MKTFGLLGHNIGYSLSEKLHPLIATKTNKTLNYKIIDINEEALSHYMELLKNDIYSGFNVTIPYKEKIISYLDELTDAAKQIGAVNTIYKRGDKLIGDNTDYIGFDYLLKASNALEKELNNVYILGSGGAAKAVYYALEKRDINAIIVARNIDQTHFKNIIDYESFYNIKDIDLLINATPVGSVYNQGCLLKENQKAKTVIDLIYNPKTTTLMKRSKNSIGGIKMLIVQAIEAQNKWFDTKTIITKELLETLKGGLENESIW